jgi:hypothetical protein
MNKLKRIIYNKIGFTKNLPALIKKLLNHKLKSFKSLLLMNYYLTNSYFIGKRGFWLWYLVAFEKRPANYFRTYYQLLYYLTIAKGDFKRAFQFFEVILSNESENFILNFRIRNITYNSKKLLDVFSGKKITIVGPAELTESDIRIINEANTIIGLNLLDENKFKKMLEQRGVCLSGKIMVSYWNYERANIFVNTAESNTTSIEHIFKNLKDENMHFLEKENFSLVQQFPQFGIQNNPNLLQIILTDLITYNPLEVWVTGADLFLTGHSGKSYYQSQWRGSKNDFLSRIFLGHDAAEQFLILKELGKNYKIYYNNRLSTIINGGLEQYFDELQLIYGKKT